jgi:hypothetical protein
MSSHFGTCPMVPFGTVTAIVMARFDTLQLYRSGADAFLSVPFYDMIVFGVLIALAIYWRTKPELHRPAKLHRNLRAHGPALWPL